MAETWQRLIDVLVYKGIVKPAAVNDLLARHRASGEAVEKLLVKAGILTREELLDLKFETFHIEPYDLKPETVDIPTGQLLPKSMADRYGVICVEREGNTLTLVSAEPVDAIARDYIRMRSGFEIRLRIACTSDVEDARRRIYAAATSTLRKEFYAPSTRTTEPVLKSRGPIHEVASGEVTHKTISLPGLPSQNGAVNVAAPQPAPQSTPRTVAPMEVPQLVRVVPVSQKSDARRGTARQAAPKVTLLPSTAVAKTIPLATAPPRPCAFCACTLDLNGGLDATQQLDNILQTVLTACDCEAVSLLVLESDRRSLFFRHASGLEAENIVNIVVPLSEASVAGWTLEHRKPLIVNNTDINPLHNKETDRMLAFATRRMAAAPILWGNVPLGVIEAVNKRLSDFSDSDLEALRIAASQLAVTLHNETTARQLSGLVVETVNALAELAKVQGQVSQQHLVEVAQLATAMGREAGLAEDDLEALSHAGILHDIGKLSGDAEDDAVSHPLRGAEVLSRVPMLARLVPYIRMHHEHWDGSGPQRMREAMIPLPARILAIAEAWCEGEPRDLIAFLDGFGTAFDPALKEAFLRAVHAEAPR